MTIFFHADDYGITPLQSQHILECRQKGCLNSLSILPNIPGLSERAAELKAQPGEKGSKLRIAVHLNLVEGHCCAPAAQLPLLVDADGKFRLSFLKMLLLSFFCYHKLSGQVKTELAAQLEAVFREFPGVPLSVDSHQHFHLIPAVFHALLEIVEEKRLPVEYLRMPAEPLLPFLKAPGLYKTYRPVNLIKNMLLNFLFLLDKPRFQRSGLKTAVFFGLMLSGCMDGARVEKLMPAFISIARRKGMDLEVLFHPGGLQEGEPPLDPGKKGFTAFYHSQGRALEKEALLCGRLEKFYPLQ